MDTVAVVRRPKTAGGKINWKSGPAIKQYFPFPDTVIYYITMNPTSSKGYNKIIQSCKYFFEANPILVVRQLFQFLGDSGKTSICSKKERHIELNNFCCTKVDLTKITSKVWIFDRIMIEGNDCPNFTSILLQKLYRCEIVELWLCDSTIPFHDFKLLAQSIKTLRLWRAIVSNGKSVLLDKLFEVCPKIEEIDCFFPLHLSMLAPSTLKDISKLLNLTNLKSFVMYNVPEFFNFQEVHDFITEEFLNAKVELIFNPKNSAEYQFQLRTIREKIRELRILNHSIE